MKHVHIMSSLLKCSDTRWAEQQAAICAWFMQTGDGFSRATRTFDAPASFSFQNFDACYSDVFC